MAQSVGPEDPATRRWVQEQLHALREELATGVRTTRIQVGDDASPHVVITASEGAAVVQVVNPTGSVSVELLAVSDVDGPHRAGLEVVGDGNGHASLLIVQTAGRDTTRCELVFDDPTGTGGWTAIDREGLHVSRVTDD